MDVFRTGFQSPTEIMQIKLQMTKVYKTMTNVIQQQEQKLMLYNDWAVRLNKWKYCCTL